MRMYPVNSSAEYIVSTVDILKFENGKTLISFTFFDNGRGILNVLRATQKIQF